MKTKNLTALTLTVLTLGVATTHVSAQNLQGYQNRLQNRPAFGNSTEAEREKRREKFQKRRGKHYGQWKKWNTDVHKSVEKISNGVVTTLTTENAEILEKLQSREPKGRGRVEVSKENISNGIKLTMTSDDTEMVERMHKRADHLAIKQSITKNVENLDNGVKVTITSTNAEAVDKIQSRELKSHRHPEIEKIITQIDNGIEITITSSDEKMVERIQKRADRKSFGKKRGLFKKFRNGKKGENGMKRFGRKGPKHDRFRGQFEDHSEENEDQN